MFAIIHLLATFIADLFKSRRRLEVENLFLHHQLNICVVPTLTFELLFAFVVVGHGRRQLLWFAVTRNPTAEWLAQQIVQAFPWNTAPTYLVRDNDGAYGQAFTRRLRTMGVRDRPTSPRSPWQNPYAETSDRNASARVPGSCPGLRRAASAADPGFVFVILQSYAHALGIEQGCAATASRPRIRNDYCHTNSVRIASSLRADMIFGKDRSKVVSMKEV
jgi:hypothetical protein